MNRVAPPQAPAARLVLAQLRAEADARLSAAGASVNATPEDAQAAPGATLSDAARTILRLALPPLAEAERGAALARVALTQLGAPAKALAGELRASLQRSGIFYEAHLRAWDAGAYPLPELRQEPQARTGPGAPESPGAALPRALEPLVREQLATLETRTAVLPLVLWPGQAATLAVAEDPDRRAEGAAPSASTAWRARLKIDLPRLGEIEFSLALHGAQLSVGVRAHQAQSRAELTRHAAALRAALARSALALERIEVSGDER